MKSTAWFVILLGSAAATCAAAPESWQYLGKTPPADERQVFLPSTSERIAISADGREIYFNDSARGISVYRYTDAGWQAPANVFAQCAAAALSPDGRTIYVQNPKGQILAATRASGGWTEPSIWLDSPERLHYVQVTSTGSAFVTRMGNSTIQGAICRATGTGTAVRLEPLPASINSGDNGVDFFVARDESYVIFVVHPGGTNGDLNIAFRRKDGSWTPTRNLGPKVNRDTTWEWGPFVSQDNKYLFFTAASSASDVAVYWIRIDGIIETLRQAALAP